MEGGREKGGRDGRKVYRFGLLYGEEEGGKKLREGREGKGKDEKPASVLLSAHTTHTHTHTHTLTHTHTSTHVPDPSSSPRCTHRTSWPTPSAVGGGRRRIPDWSF